MKTDLFKATKEEINNAYRRLSKMYHPDKHVDPALKSEAEIMFHKTKTAYEGKPQLTKNVSHLLTHRFNYSSLRSTSSCDLRLLRHKGLGNGWLGNRAAYENSRRNTRRVRKTGRRTCRTPQTASNQSTRKHNNIRQRYRPI